MTPDEKTKVIYNNIKDVVPSIRLIQKWSTKKGRFYDFIELSFQDNDYKKLIIIQDIEKLLIDTLKQTKIEHKKVERSFLEDDIY